jgi:hypothetical protein
VGDKQMIRIATFYNYEKMPYWVKDLFIETLFPMDRVAVFDDKSNFLYVLDNACATPPSNIIEKAIWNAEHRKDGTLIKTVLSIEHNDDLIIYGPTFREWAIYIREVDENRPWTIITSEELDEDEEEVLSTSEYIKYLDYEVVNKEINYCRRITK